MTFNLSGLLLAGTAWVLAVVLAWPAGHPTAAVVLLAVQAACYLAAGLQQAAAGTPTLHVRIRRRPK